MQRFLMLGLAVLVVSLFAACGGGKGDRTLPDAGIVFFSDRDTNFAVFAMKGDGSDQVRLTDAQAKDYWPARSPDGSKIAFTSERDGNREVYVMNADGSDQTNLTSSPARDSWSSWSPDGTKIAFVSNRDGNDDVFVMNADGSNPVRLTDSPEGDRAPVWSPDGSKIAFTSERDGNAEIYVMNGDGSAQTNLTNNPAWEYWSAWSPDGSKIAFTYREEKDGQVNDDVYVINADGSKRANLTDNTAPDREPAWSPDGAWIAFTSERDGNAEVYLMEADGSGPVNLTKNPASDSGPSFAPPRTSPVPGSSPTATAPPAGTSPSVTPPVAGGSPTVTPPVAGGSPTVTPPVASGVEGSVELLGSMPHEGRAWTEGLLVSEGVLWESTGGAGQSKVRGLDRQTGDVVWSVPNTEGVFGEGLVRAFDRTYLLSYTEGKAYLFDRDASAPYTLFATYEGEGWGLTANADYLINSNGSANLYYRDPDTFSIVREVPIQYGGQPVERLNEMEFDGTYIWVNQWRTPYIYRILESDPTDIVRYTLPADTCPGGTPNGIAWDQEEDVFFLTGQTCENIWRARFQ